MSPRDFKGLPDMLQFRHGGGVVRLPVPGIEACPFFKRHHAATEPRKPQDRFFVRRMLEFAQRRFSPDAGAARVILRMASAICFSTVLVLTPIRRATPA
jgi:hypothetical protein